MASSENDCLSGFDRESLFYNWVPNLRGRKFANLGVESRTRPFKNADETMNIEGLRRRREIHIANAPT